MEKESKNIQITADENEPSEGKPKKTATLKKIALAGGIILLIGIGIAWKCWDDQRIDLKKLSTDELKELRDKLQEVLLSSNSEQQDKTDSIKWINVIDNIVRARNPVDMKTFVFPKGGEHGTNLWKPD